jgi:hypothetical protein
MKSIHSNELISIFHERENIYEYGGFVNGFEGWNLRFIELYRKARHEICDAPDVDS